MSSAAAGFAIASAVAAAVSAAADDINKYQNARSQERVAKYNARVTEERIKALNYEESMNESLLRANAYSEVGSAKAVMAGRGNVGTSADAAVFNAYKNLAGDLSTMSFNYWSKRFDLGVERDSYWYQSKIARENKISSIFNLVTGTHVVGDGSKSMANYFAVRGTPSASTAGQTGK